MKNDFSIIYRCLHYFSSCEKLQLYEVDCQKINDCAIRLPSEDDKWLEFDNCSNRERGPFIVYANLECVLCKTESDKKDTSSYAYQRHEAFSILRTMRVWRHIIVVLLPSRWRLYNLIRATTHQFGTSREKYHISAHGNSNGRHTVARRVVTSSARNRSRRTIRESAIIVISPVDITVQRIQIVT